MTATEILQIKNDNPRFVWSENTHCNRLDPQTCGERIISITKKHGNEFFAEHVVEDAKDPESPLHNGFEWNNSKAAHLHRLEQARYLVRSIRIVESEDKHGKPITVHRAFIHVRNPIIDGEQSDFSAYVHRDRLLNDPDLRQRAIEEAHILLLGIQKRFEEISELKGVFREIRRLGRKIAAKRVSAAKRSKTNSKIKPKKVPRKYKRKYKK